MREEKLQEETEVIQQEMWLDQLAQSGKRKSKGMVLRNLCCTREGKLKRRNFPGKSTAGSGANKGKKSA